jgi:hypothetical protein
MPDVKIFVKEKGNCVCSVVHIYVTAAKECYMKCGEGIALEFW